METETYGRLEKLHAKYGSREFGKLCQKLLAIAFQMAGYGHIVERGVQGVDIDVAKEKGSKYAIEVKTTTKKYINFEVKDMEGLQRRKKDGYQPILAVLCLNMFSDWIFAKADRLKPGSIYVARLRAYKLCELEKCIAPFFDKALNEHFKGAMREGQRYLNDVLRQRGIKVSETWS